MGPDNGLISQVERAAWRWGRRKSSFQALQPTERGIWRFMDTPVVKHRVNLLLPFFSWSHHRCQNYLDYVLIPMKRYDQYLLAWKTIKIIPRPFWLLPQEMPPTPSSLHRQEHRAVLPQDVWTRGFPRVIRWVEGKWIFGNVAHSPLYIGSDIQ